jgi:hypothetical protein
VQETETTGALRPGISKENSNGWYGSEASQIEIDDSLGGSGLIFEDRVVRPTGIRV